MQKGRHVFRSSTKRETVYLSEMQIRPMRSGKIKYKLQNIIENYLEKVSLN